MSPFQTAVRFQKRPGKSDAGNGNYNRRHAGIAGADVDAPDFHAFSACPLIVSVLPFVNAEVAPLRFAADCILHLNGHRTRDLAFLPADPPVVDVFGTPDFHHLFCSVFEMDHIFQNCPSGTPGSRMEKIESSGPTVHRDGPDLAGKCGFCGAESVITARFRFVFGSIISNGTP